jgi:hypothetical protein
MRPRLLDLCCCAGGATKGYQRAGFWDVHGSACRYRPAAELSDGLRKSLAAAEARLEAAKACRSSTTGYFDADSGWRGCSAPRIIELVAALSVAPQPQPATIDTHQARAVVELPERGRVPEAPGRRLAPTARKAAQS